MEREKMPEAGQKGIEKKQFSPLSRVEVMYVVRSVSLISVIVPRPSSVI